MRVWVSKEDMKASPSSNTDCRLCRAIRRKLGEFTYVYVKRDVKINNKTFECTTKDAKRYGEVVIPQKPGYVYLKEIR